MSARSHVSHELISLKAILPGPGPVYTDVGLSGSHGIYCHVNRLVTAMKNHTLLKYEVSKNDWFDFYVSCLVEVFFPG